jgi:hypothetical protein
MNDEGGVANIMRWMSRKPATFKRAAYVVRLRDRCCAMQTDG